MKPVRYSDPGNVRRAAFTAGAASFLTLIAFLILRSQALQAPTPYHGVWLNLPTVPKESVGQVSIGMGEWASKQLTEPGLSQQDAALAQSDSPSIPLSEPRQVQHEGPLCAINLYQGHEILTRGDFFSALGMIQGVAKEIRHAMDRSAPRRL